jgi:hypothetical protein
MISFSMRGAFSLYNFMLLKLTLKRRVMPRIGIDLVVFALFLQECFSKLLIF